MQYKKLIDRKDFTMTKKKESCFQWIKVVNKKNLNQELFCNDKKKEGQRGSDFELLL